MDLLKLAQLQIDKWDAETHVRADFQQFRIEGLVEFLKLVAESRVNEIPPEGNRITSVFSTQDIPNDTHTETTETQSEVE